VEEGLRLIDYIRCGYTLSWPRENRKNSKYLSNLDLFNGLLITSGSAAQLVAALGGCKPNNAGCVHITFASAGQHIQPAAGESSH
jgi:hypothetical protein